MRLLTESKAVLKTVATGKYIESKHNHENNKDDHEND